MLLSTFELLLKPITPTAGTVSGSDRSILQGYFLNVANPNNTSLRLRLRFNAQSPPIDRTKLLVARDTGGTNEITREMTSLTAGNTYDFRLNAGDTGLVILQPDIRTLNPANERDQIEVRGYVEIFAVSSFPFPGRPRTFPLLVTPEHRGTFLPSPGTSGDFDQLITALPTSSGSALLNVDTVFDSPVLDGPFVPLPEFPQPIPVPIDPIGPVAGPINPGVVSQLENIQQVLGFMAQRLDDLSQPVPNGLPSAVANGAQRQPVA